MADIPVVDNNTISSQNEILEKTTNAFNGYNAIMSRAGEISSGLQNKISGLNTIFEQNQALTTRQSQLLALVTNAALGARDAFAGIAGIDFSGLNTFSGQIERMQQIFQNSPAYKEVAKELDAVKKAAVNMVGGLAGDEAKAAIKVVEDKIKNLTGFISDETKAIAKNADNALKLRDVYTYLAARTGELGDVHQQAGTNFENMNALIDAQRKSIDDSAQAMQLDTTIVEKYYTQLGSVRGALSANIPSLKGMTGGVNLLTSTVQLARGAGMEYADVIDTMKKAVVSYGADIPEALAMTAKISEVSKKYKLELNDVKSAILGVSDAFKTFGKDTTSFPQIMNQFVGALKGTGISGQVATDIVSNMTKQMSQLTIAQKAFISAQSGGPGGIQGSFQIDKLLREEGGQKKVMDMMMKTMTRQLGPLVSLDDAAKGGPAQGQYLRQISMLQQGPLGSLVKSQAEAEHLIDAMKLMSEGKQVDFTELKPDEKIVQDLIKEGNNYQKQTATGMSNLLSHFNKAQGDASGGSLEFVQRRMTAGAGEQYQDEEQIDSIRNTRNYLSDTMKRAATRDSLSGIGMEGDQVKNKSGYKDFLLDTLDFSKAAKDIIKAPMDSMKNVMDLNKSAAEEQRKIAEEHERKRALSPAQQAANTAQLTREMSLVDVGHERVGRAANRASARAANDIPVQNTARDNVNHQHVDRDLGTVKVHIEGYCLECQTKIKGSDQIIGTGSNSRN